MKTLIDGGTIVNEGHSYKGSILIEDDRIADITTNTEFPRSSYDQLIDASGCFIMPGVIDEHVHYREPGLERKADIGSETRAAAYGGVTSFFEMPNTVPQTTTLDALEEKFRLAKAKSHINYSFFFGATNHNHSLFEHIDRHRIPGIKLFMGASTGNMLVDQYGSLLQIFQTAARLELPLMVHCEDGEIISRNLKKMKEVYGDDPDIFLHPLIRSEEACYESSAFAVQLARNFGTRLHIAHVSTAKELDLFGRDPKITGEAVIAHLLFSAEDYAQKRALIKCNPAVKSAEDRDALRRALTDGRIETVATDHAPHLLSEKQGGCCKAASGMPMIQFSLPAMLKLVDGGVLSIERVVQLMCHHPAKLFQVRDRGYLRKGYKADVAIVKPHDPWTVDPECIQSKCRWSPLEGSSFQWSVVSTICNGHLIYNKGVFDETYRGEEISFR